MSDNSFKFRRYGVWTDKNGKTHVGEPPDEIPQDESWWTPTRIATMRKRLFAKDSGEETA